MILPSVIRVNDSDESLLVHIDNLLCQRRTDLLLFFSCEGYPHNPGPHAHHEGTHTLELNEEAVRFLHARLGQYIQEYDCYGTEEKSDE